MLGINLSSAISRLIEKPSEVIINTGDYVKYYDHVTQETKVGIYVDLWYYISKKTETSPFPMNDALCEWTMGRDNHVPIWHAYIQTGTENQPSTTYANIDSIELASEIDWMRFHFGSSNEGQVA